MPCRASTTRLCGSVECGGDEYEWTSSVRLPCSTRVLSHRWDGGVSGCAKARRGVR